jgi:hypothetical protein
MLLGLLMGINLCIIATQYLVSPYIITYLGFSAEQLTHSSKTGRWVGLFEGINTLADSALLLYLLNEYVRPKIYGILRIIFGLTVLVSTSKHAIIILALFTLFFNLNSHRYFSVNKNGLIKYILVAILASTILAAGYYFNKPAVDSKLYQYTYFMHNIDDISLADATHIEKRALNAGIGLSITHENPFGTGLGTWGDASSTHNRHDYQFDKVELSDSNFIHLLVEQGVFVIFYYMLLYSAYFQAKRNGNSSHFNALMLIIFLVSVVTMGLSSGGWPLLFAYMYARVSRMPLVLPSHYMRLIRSP